MTTHDELREEWLSFNFKLLKEQGLELNSLNIGWKSALERDADWWLAKLTSSLQARDKELAQKIKKLPKQAICGEGVKRAIGFECGVFVFEKDLEALLSSPEEDKK